MKKFHVLCLAVAAGLILASPLAATSELEPLTPNEAASIEVAETVTATGEEVDAVVADEVEAVEIFTEPEWLANEAPSQAIRPSDGTTGFGCVQGTWCNGPKTDPACGWPDGWCNQASRCCMCY